MENRRAQQWQYNQRHRTKYHRSLRRVLLFINLADGYRQLTPKSKKRRMNKHHEIMHHLLRDVNSMRNRTVNPAQIYVCML
jgi:hypothetical protein